MNLTQYQRDLNLAHISRRNIFWPSAKSEPPMLPDFMSGEKFFSMAWKLLDDRPTIGHIQEVTAKHFSVPLLFMEVARRNREAYLPRAAAIYLCRMHTAKSYPVIGRHFGGRDHTTVMHSIRAVEKMIDLNHPIKKDIEFLSEKLRGEHD